MSANVADLLRSAAERRGSRVAIVAGPERLTWADLDAQVDVLAAGLRGRGLVRGDRLALSAATGPSFVRVWYAALRAGLVVVPLNPGYTPRELRELVEDSGARLLVTDRPVATDLPAPVVRIGDADWNALNSHPDAATVARSAADRPADDPPPGRAGHEDLAALVYTSGTSGRPRGAMLSHRALLANLEQLSALRPPPVGPDDVVLVPLPLFHIYGLNIGLCLPTAQAATVVMVPRFDPVATRELVTRERVTVVIGAPPVYLAWSMLPPDPKAFARVRVAVSGAAPLPPHVLERMHSQTGRVVYEGYGMTEAAPVLTMTPPATEPRPGSVGRPIPGVELRLRDADGGGVETGDPGEVVVRGANLFSGYWPDGSGGPDPDGWFATGDVGVLDADGDLRLVDRLGDVIIVSGFNVHPREVEDVLRNHPAVADVAVLGMPHPYTGETVRALVVPAAGTSPTQQELVAHAAGSLARFKCPTVVELVPALPHTVTGKVSRARLAAPGPAASPARDQAPGTLPDPSPDPA